MIEDSKTDGLKRNVLEELNDEIPFDDPNIFDDTSESFYKKSPVLLLIIACI